MWARRRERACKPYPPPDKIRFKRRPPALPTQPTSTPACGWWSCRCRDGRRRCRWSLQGRRAEQGRRITPGGDASGEVVAQWLHRQSEQMMAPLHAPAYHPWSLTRGLEALQVAVHVQTDIVQLRLLRSAVHKRVARLQLGGGAGGRLREQYSIALHFFPFLKANEEAAAQVRHHIGRQLTRPKSFSRSVWRPWRVVPPVRAAIVWRRRRWTGGRRLCWVPNECRRQLRAAEGHTNAGERAAEERVLVISLKAPLWQQALGARCSVAGCWW